MTTPLTATGPAVQTPASSLKPRDEALWNACADFEALLYSQLLKSVRENQPKDGLIPRSDGEQIFQDMLDGEYAKEMSLANPSGVAMMMYRQIQAMAPSSPAGGQDVRTPSQR